MDKLFIRLTAIGFAFYLCLSCSFEKETIDRSLSFVDGFEAYDLIGIEHNKGLDFVFMSLENHFFVEAPKSFQSVYDVFEIAMEANNTFVKQYELGEEAENFVISHIQHVFSNEHPMLHNHPKHKLICKDLADQLSWELKHYLERLESIVLQIEGSLEVILSELDGLAWDAYVSLPDPDDQIVVLSGISVARHTLIYWYENHLKWQILLSDISGRHALKSGFDWKELGVEDVAGAIGGAAGARVAAFFGPIGWKAMAGVIGGAATANSVKYAIVCLLADSLDDSEDHSDE